VSTIYPYQTYIEPNPDLGPIWNDADDATYTSQWVDGGPPSFPGGFPNYSGALLTEFAGDYLAVTGVVVHVRASATRTDGLTDPVMVEYDLYRVDPADPVGSSPAPVGDGGNVRWRSSVDAHPIESDGVIRDYSWPMSAENLADAHDGVGDSPPLNGVAYAAADVAKMATLAPAIEFYDAGSSSSGDINRVVYIYEVSVELVATRRLAPPLRQYPRSDGLGASSARRLWPPSRSVQRSNRRVGGYL
jgi:hypothetical protein